MKIQTRVGKRGSYTTPLDEKTITKMMNMCGWTLYKVIG